MTAIRRILFPVDFSGKCMEIIPLVKEFAAKYEAEVQLLHVVNPVYVIPETGITGPGIIARPEWEIAQHAEKLNAFAIREFQGCPVSQSLYEGDAEAQIVAAAKDVQLVVMPTHGYGVFRKFLLGSMTAKVLHDVTCLVLTGVHFDTPVHSRMPAQSTIVCAIDLASHSSETLSWAVRLAADFESTLNIVHAIPLMNPSLRPVFSSELRDQLEDLVRANIRTMQTSAGADNTKVFIQEGDIPAVVCDYAKSVAAHLVVIGRGKQEEHGRLRPNTYGIIRQSPCPVFSV